MPIRFAAPARALPCRMQPGEAVAYHCAPANDDGARVQGDPTIHAALRHFARHGIAAAEHAQEQAKTALLAGDRQSYDWWLDICRAFDRRMAHALDRRAADCFAEAAGS